MVPDWLVFFNSFVLVTVGWAVVPHIITSKGWVRAIGLTLVFSIFAFVTFSTISGIFGIEEALVRSVGVGIGALVAGYFFMFLRSKITRQ